MHGSFCLWREGCSRGQGEQQGVFQRLFHFSELDKCTEFALGGVEFKGCAAPVPDLELPLLEHVSCFPPAPAAAEGQFHGGAGGRGSQATPRLSFH